MTIRKSLRSLRIWALLGTAIIAMSLSGCYRQPQPHNEVLVIGPSETGFLVPLEGDNLKAQGKLNSLEYLKSQKVAAKSVVITHHVVNLCPSCSRESDENYRDVPDALLYKVNRAMVARSWTSSSDTGTSSKNQAFHAEDNASIDFWMGANATAYVEEDDTALFLYRYSGKQLEDVVDSVVRNEVSVELSAICGAHDLNWIRANKGEILRQVTEKTKAFAKAQGITVASLGFTDGITYSDQNIQDAINKKFAADMSVQEAQSRKLAAEAFAQAGEAALKLQEMDMRRKSMDLQGQIIAKWDGHLPQVLTAGADPFAAFAAANVMSKK